MTTEREHAEECFPRDTSKHEMTVLHDDGLYRHLRFARPGTNNMSFNIVTWPGYLAYSGDMGDYMFTRLTDMFDFFRGDRINPGYWGEKLVAGEAKKYSPEVAAAWIAECLAEADPTDDVRADAARIDTSEGEEWTHRQLHDFPGNVFSDSWEANFKEHTGRYIWCCLALVWGIMKYDEAKASARAGTPFPTGGIP